MLPTWRRRCTKHKDQVQHIYNNLSKYHVQFIMHIWIVMGIIFLLILGLLDVWHYPLFTFLWGAFVPYMWAYGHDFHTKDIDDGNMIQDCGVKDDFDQSSHARHHDQTLIEGKLGYNGNIQEIMQVDISSFQCVIFCHKWWDTFDTSNVNEYHNSEIICINSKKCGMKPRILMFS